MNNRSLRSDWFGSAFSVVFNGFKSRTKTSIIMTPPTSTPDLKTLFDVLVQKLTEDTTSSNVITIELNGLTMKGTLVECTAKNPVDIAWNGQQVPHNRKSDLRGLLNLLFEEDRPFVTQATDSTPVRRVWDKA